VSHVLVEETITQLEMTSPDQLVPGRPPPAPLRMERHGRASLPLLRSTCIRIGAPHGWVTRPAWSDAQWERWLARPEVQPWIARVGGDLLTLGTRLAWAAEHPDGTPTRRVWLQTSSRDHPHALPNYQRRGFRPFHTERRRREVPG
jgi:hypothetical protein